MRRFQLILIILLAFSLRFFRLNDYPALNADEAAIGYNAFSLIQTGKDEHGNLWPIHFQSFNDYKPGLYFYLVIPFVKVLGLNEWAVRVPNAFLGVVTVYLVYLLGKEAFPEKKIGTGNVSSPSRFELGTLASLLLAISPWHIHFSRGGWEVNVATFFIVLAIYLFLKGINHFGPEAFSPSDRQVCSRSLLRTIWYRISLAQTCAGCPQPEGRGIRELRIKNLAFLTLSVLSFSLSLYSYHAARIVVPLLIFGLMIIYRTEFKRNLKNFLFIGLVGFLAILPLIREFKEVSARASGVGLFADPGPLARINEQRGEHKNYASYSAKVLHNKAINYSLSFLENWSKHFHGEFLFLSGDVIQRNRVPETGQLYILDILLLVTGLGWMVRNQTKSSKLVFWWLVIAPIASALTFQSPNALRAENMVIPLEIISAYGLVIFLEKISFIGLKLLRVMGYGIIGILVFWGFLRYIHMYWVHMAKEYPFSSQYGVKELVSYLKERENNFEKIIVTDKYDQPYILFLFYLNYPPKYFQSNHELTSRDKFGFSTVRTFDKYEFRSIDFAKNHLQNPNSLIIGTDEEIPNSANIVKGIYGTNGYLYFEVVAN
ncbi:hypothetical protein A2686_04600 [Candidatus Woesebacteria bacterium RIFCSPHIGHO2_01_FULL_38_10]|uniref:ArnT-like N-terminal domain-containing protein n=1 Tax=Candidatus Woesebacteria bacterium RIFCSPLOWO2_01_FULL_39_10b TaxID=1802517 RepID=A0A1F8BB92_9BACT|nr:MAG: hypothetical protein A2686_04600 [Candidatus Woesebacteria bacterium RIFCSPHIGHO2_01_FULL_38_10]OGM60618.1 MAG: hypothetical protein A2892_01060 [Candidatus Woesebacteria bacterium RIFCSPLOWO2_01_FULL_39_10b]